MRYNIVLSDWGIGDAICSLYCIQALTLKYPQAQIVFYIRNQFQWVALADIPQMSTLRYKDKLKISDPIFLHDPLIDQKLMNSPKQLYASKLQIDPVKPLLKSFILQAEPIFKEKYIVISPFASRTQRSWEIKNWKVLAQMLVQKGYRVIALDSHRQEKRCKELGIDFFCGKNASWTANICLHSSLIISNDPILAQASACA